MVKIRKGGGMRGVESGRRKRREEGGGGLDYERTERKECE